ncbi:MAG TPA: ABC transporter permease [Gemmatimonadaceae bacterium]
MIEAEGARASSSASASSAGRHVAPAPVAETQLRAGTVAWLKEIIARRDLLVLLAWREIKVKYKQSVMGFLWAILMPALIVSAGVIVKFAFATFSGKTLDHSDVVNVAVRSVPWAFFVGSIRFASTSLVSNSNLVTKVYMPRVIFPAASVLSQLMDLGVATGVLVIFLAVTGANVTLQLLWVPVLLAVMIVLVTGLAVFLSAAALFMRDVKYIVEVVLTFAIFFTPVFYEVSMLGKWSHILLLNPVAPLLEGIAAAVLGRPVPADGWLLYSVVASIVILFGSLAFFRRTEPYFAEAV